MDGGTSAVTCTTTQASGQCEVTCGSDGNTTTLTYTLTSNGFTGTGTQSRVVGEDGGTYTCTGTVTATKT